MAARFVAIAIAIDRALDERRGAIAGAIRPHRPYGGARAVLIGKARHDVEASVEDGLVVRFGTNEAIAVESDWRPGEMVWVGTVDGVRVAATARPILNGTALSHGGSAADVRVFTRRQADLAALMLERADADDQKALLCPMPGLVKKIHVKEGQAVKAGEPLCLVEAMKMENVLRAERDVTVKSIEAAEGASLTVDAPIMTFA